LSAIRAGKVSSDVWANPDSAFTMNKTGRIIRKKNDFIFI
jgi:hypothetical protein